MANAFLLTYLLIVPPAAALIYWQWRERRVPADVAGAIVLAMWWPIVFVAVVHDAFDSEID